MVSPRTQQGMLLLSLVMFSALLFNALLALVPLAAGQRSLQLLQSTEAITQRRNLLRAEMLIRQRLPTSEELVSAQIGSGIVWGIDVTTVSGNTLHWRYPLSYPFFRQRLLQRVGGTVVNQYWYGQLQWQPE